MLMVDTISGLASTDFRFDEWGIDVAVSGSQKGLMLPPGISFNCVGPKALEVSTMTVKRDWKAAKAWLVNEIGGEDHPAAHDPPETP